MAHEFIYTAYKLARHYPPDRTVLENISISAQICPNSIGPWAPITGTQSGAVWNGLESGTAFEAAIGTQELHSPPAAATTHNSTYTITWNCGLDC